MDSPLDRLMHFPVVRFFKGFIDDPKGVGSVIPSSSVMEAHIVRACKAKYQKLLVELGPGTGGTTRAMLKAIPQDAKLLCIEVNESFCQGLQAIDDPRLIVHHGSAEDLSAILKAHGLGQPDVVYSGIPFSTMPRTLGESIQRAIRENLKSGGYFVAYQFRSEVANIAQQIFGNCETSKMEWLNIPPMRVYRWVKT